MNIAGAIRALEAMNRNEPDGKNLNLGRIDLTVKTITGTVVGVYAQSVATPLRGDDAQSGFVWTNGTGENVTVTGIQFIANVAAATGTTDVRKIPTGVTAPTGGVTLLTGGLASTANTLQTGTLTATLADRIVAPNEKISYSASAALTGLAGGVLTVFYQTS